MSVMSISGVGVVSGVVGGMGVEAGVGGGCVDANRAFRIPLRINGADILEILGRRCVFEALERIEGVLVLEFIMVEEN